MSVKRKRTIGLCRGVTWLFSNGHRISSLPFISILAFVPSFKFIFAFHPGCLLSSLCSHVVSVSSLHQPPSYLLGYTASCWLSFHFATAIASQFAGLLLSECVSPCVTCVHYRMHDVKHNFTCIVLFEV